jgi:transposase-like protein
MTITDGAMATTGARRRPQKYPDELRERAVRMVFEIRDETGESHGVITRVARQLGIGTESLRAGRTRPTSTQVVGPRRRRPTRNSSPSWNAR